MNADDMVARDRLDPVHRSRCRDDCWWSTDNASEALPGIITPLTWTFFGDPLERAMKGTFYDMGVYRRDEVVAHPDAEHRLMDVFYGRAAGNLNSFRDIGDRTPGTSGNAIEEQIFGSVRPGVASRPVYRRYPVVVVKAPYAALRLRPRLDRSTRAIRGWWQELVSPGRLRTVPEAQATLRLANRRFEDVMRPHTLAAMLCQGLYDQLLRLAESAGLPGHELRLVTGYGDMAETAVVTDLWEVSRDRLTLEEFVRRHGFHGPGEGELSSRVWRLRRDPLEALAQSYRGIDDDRDPRLVEARRREERRRAEAELLSALPAWRRPRARLLFAVAARFIPLRGTGKAAFLRCIDVARHAAWLIGAEYADRGLLARPDDVFMLTMPELTGAPPPDMLELTLARRARQDAYRGLEIPSFFRGVPEATARPRPEERAEEIVVTGAPVSPGVVDGVVRVVLDPEEAELDDGEVLVCRMTDPSWASVMMLASALVIDIGGPISHGAIVARELGVPCVIGTRNGTTLLRTGDRVRVDGQRGRVHVLEPAPGVR